VLLDHTGDPTWLQRAWAACLAVWPAALCHDSALRALDGPGRRDHVDRSVLHVAVCEQRSPVAPPGVRLHRLADFDRKALMHTAPPRLRVEEAVLDLAAEAPDELAAVQQLADAVQSRRTTAPRLRDAVRGRRRLSRRQFLLAVLDDVEEGACSVLEHGYLTRVERAHGLPVALRQSPLPTRPGLSDVEYAAWGLVVELDGRMHHDHAVARDRDLDRDLDTAVAGRTTIRLGWGQVFRRPCATARRVGVLLSQRGWRGLPRTCPSCASRAEDAGRSQSPGDSDRPLSA
jgi:hypothetical protein